MLVYKNIRLFFYSVCFWHTMQSMDTLKEVLVNIKNTFTKHKASLSSEAAYKNIQKTQCTAFTDELSTEEESSTEEKTEKQDAKSRNLSAQYYRDEEKELKALQQFFNCHKVIASV